MRDEQTLGRKTTSFWRRKSVVGFIVGAVLFLISFFVANQHQITGLNATVFHAINNLPGTFATPGLWTTQLLGSGYGIAACVVIPLLFKRFRLSWRFFVTIGATGLVMEIAKILVKAPRPVALLHGDLHARAVETGLNSFPSGHAAMATAMALTVWLILPKAWRWVSVVWIALVMFTRVYLGVHAPVDVLGGFAIGLAVACAIQLLPQRLSRPLRLDRPEDLLKKGF